MKVFEFQCKIKFLKDVEYQNVYEKTTYLLDSVLIKDEQYLKFHESKDYKFYVTDAPWPVEADGIYKKNHIYTLRIRSVDGNLIEFFYKTSLSASNKRIAVYWRRSKDDQSKTNDQ